ncbi:MAG: dipicolinate synthase subunit DpsA [Firmicutes bacterium]|nr:dipicolinate synthase subunit DpsA [Bacillota bacterium]
MLSSILHNLHIVVLGGDLREITIAAELAARGAKVSLLGFDLYQGEIYSKIHKGLPEKAEVVILPLPGIFPDHSIYAPYSAEKIDIFSIEYLLQPKIKLFCGKMPELTLQYLQKLGVKVLLTANLPEVAIYNAVPTAEGAVETAMREAKITIFGSSILITGFGRCAKYLARILKALGASITIAARKKEDLVEALTFGYQGINLAKIPAYAAEYDFIFNTVPSLVLTEQVLAQLKKDALIFDLASSPGGTDFAAAEKLGIRAQLLPGLPGKAAPVSAGKKLTEIYLYYLEEEKGGKQ